MSKSAGQLIGGAIGAVVGYIYGGPQGAQIGWTIGSAVGGYVDPAKNYGPRLNDAAQQTAIDGVPISFGYGTYPTTGNIIWTSPLREVRKKERAGKGGQQVNITYEYYRSYAISVAEGPITGFLQVRRNGKIVYDARPDSDLIEIGYTAQQVKQIRAAQAKFLNNITLYLGDETQMPDATIESHEGIGNVPAYRGLAYMVVEEDNLTGLQGAIPQYEFVVSACGSTDINGAGGSAGWLTIVGDELFRSVDGLSWVDPSVTVPPWSSDYTTTPNRVESEILLTGNSFLLSVDTGTTWQYIDNPYPTALDGGRAAKIDAFWYVSSGTGFEAVKWTGGAVEQAGFSCLDLAAFDGYLATVAHLSSVVSFRNKEGVVIEANPIVVSGNVYYPKLAVGGGTLLIMFSVEPGVAKMSVTGAANDDVLPVACPFPYVSGAAFIAKYSVGLGLWVVLYGRRIAFGASAGALALSSHILPSSPLWLDEDGEKFIICGESGMLESSIDGDSWNTVAGPVGSSSAIQSVLSLGQFGIPAGSDPIPDAPGWYIGPDGNIYGPGSEVIDRCRPVLGTVVADLLKRVGLASDEYDVSELTDLLDGYRIHGESGVDAMISPLMQAYFFDAAEIDGEIRFIKRGGNSALSIGPDDFVETDGDPVEWERVQEAEILRKQTVAFFAPEAGYTRSTQSAERRSATIEAKGESLVEIPVVCRPDDGAKIADKRLKISWSEPDKCKFRLPYRHSGLTACDVIQIYDDDGRSRRVRLVDVQVDTGCHYIEAILDRQSAYQSSATGVLPPPPTIMDPPLTGPTVAAIINGPILAETDDELGLYIGAAGMLSGWNGATIEYSTDGGTNYIEAGTITDSAVIGTTLSAIQAEHSSEYLSSQSLDVRLPSAPESVDYATLLRYFNRAAVQLPDGSWSVLQYQTVTTIGTGEFRLSEVKHGRYGTNPGLVGMGARFVLIDSSVKFIQTPTFLLGSEILVRLTSIGTSSDAATPQTFDFSVGASQTEWLITYVRAIRDDSDNVNVSWVGRGRLGTDVSPRHSKYFTGYAVEVDDGSSVTVRNTPDSSLVLPAVVDPISIRVAAINSITGIGPYSEAITA